MAYDYFTLRTFVAELNDILVGRSIVLAASVADGIALMVGRKGLLQLTVGTAGMLTWNPKAKAPCPSDKEGPAQYLLGAKIVSLKGTLLAEAVLGAKIVSLKPTL